MWLMVQLLFFLLVGYLACVVVMFLFQESFLFFPPKARHRDHGYDHVVPYQLEQKSATLRGWLVNPEQAERKLLVYYGGNAEDVFLNVDEYSDIRAASLFVSYRGYGPSDGKPGEKELFSDALAVIDDLVGRYSPEEIYLIGRSLGSGVACYVAAHREVRGAILITPYDSILNIAKSAYPWLPVSFLLKHRFDSVQQLAGVSCPLLILYGGLDRVVPPTRTKKLIENIRGEKKLVYIDRADHGTIDMFPEYWEAILNFIDSRERETAGPE